MNSATVATANNVNTDSSAVSTQVSNSDAAVTSASADTSAQGGNVASEQQTITSAQPATATTSQARADWYSGYSTGWQSSRNYDGTYVLCSMVWSRTFVLFRCQWSLCNK